MGPTRQNLSVSRANTLIIKMWFLQVLFTVQYRYYFLFHEQLLLFRRTGYKIMLMMLLITLTTKSKVWDKNWSVKRKRSGINSRFMRILSVDYSEWSPLVLKSLELSSPCYRPDLVNPRFLANRDRATKGTSFGIQPIVISYCNTVWESMDYCTSLLTRVQSGNVYHFWVKLTVQTEIDEFRAFWSMDR